MAQPEILILSIIAGAVFAGLLAVASLCDVRTRRIPNALVLAGVAAGLMLNALGAGGLGLFNAAQPGGLGLLRAGAGLLVGVGLLLPLYLVRGMGAGDVKLMGMVGVFLGPLSVIDAALMTLVAGGVLAAAVAFWNGTISHAIANVRFMLIDALLSASRGESMQLAPLPQCAGTVPYALAIASGTVLHVLLQRNGFSLFAPPGAL